MASHFNQLTAGEDERLAILSEECAEVIQIIGKIQRHGYNSYHPDCDPSNVIKNRVLLEKEVGHVRATITLMLCAEDMVEESIEDAAKGKIAQLVKYTHHQTNRLLSMVAVVYAGMKNG